MTRADIVVEDCDSHAEAAQLAYVVDDDSDMRRSLHALLQSFEVRAWPFSTARDFIDAIGSLRPAPILLDIRMQDMNGIELMRALAALGVRWPVIVMTGHAEIPLAVQAMKLGAIDFLEKPFNAALLQNALQHSFAELRDEDRRYQEKVAARISLSQLTKREAEVALGLKAGNGNKIIGHELGVSVRTVEMHRANLMHKIGHKQVAGLIDLIIAAGGDDWLRTLSHSRRVPEDCGLAPRG